MRKGQFLPTLSGGVSLPEEMKRVNLTSNAGTPPKPDEELLQKIEELENPSFEGVARIIKEHKEQKRKESLKVGCKIPDFNDRLTI